jgi:hypothetical protein
LHFAVAFAGASPLAFAVAFAVVFGAVGFGVSFAVDAGAVGVAGVVAVGAFSSASQVWTPPCREHAPCFVFAVEYVPSLQWAVAPLGADCAAIGIAHSNAQRAAVLEAVSTRRNVAIMNLQGSIVAQASATER